MKLLLSFLLVAVATAQYSTGSGYGQSYGGQGYDGLNTVPNVGPVGSYGQTLAVPANPSTYQAPASPKVVSNYGGSYGKSNGYGSSYGGSYSQPTGQPYGIQSSGDYSSQGYYEEPLDLSRCGPTPTENPCTISGSQYYPLPGYPHCYIQCAFERMFVKPCPANLVWNARINVCDWSAVGSYGSSYENSGASYGATGGSYQQEAPSSYSYGRKKRSTTERKKRNIFPVPPIPIGAPFFPFALPGPVGFPGPLGFPGLPGLPGPLGIPTPFIFPLPEDDYSYSDYNDYGSSRGYGKGSKRRHGKKYKNKHSGYSSGSKYGSGYGDDYGFDIGSFLDDNFVSDDGHYGGHYSKYDDSYHKKPSYKKYGNDDYHGTSSYNKYGNNDYYGKSSYNKYGNDDQYGTSSYNSYGNDDHYGTPSYSKYGKDDHYGTSSYNSYGNDDHYGTPSYNKYGNDDHYGTSSYNSYGDDDYYGSSSNKKYGKNDYKSKSNYKKNGNFKSYGKGHKSKSYSDDYYRKKRDYGSNSIIAVETKPVAVEQTSYVLLGKTQLPIATLCAGKSTQGNLPHPTDSTKYIACTDYKNQQVMDCPEGLIYNSILDQCENAQNPESLCESQNPCLNEGQCYQTGPSSLKCTCRNGWTGEYCETPVSACANNPCGEGNTCHTLKAQDYTQDFVCVCEKGLSYGLSCQNTVPNPCYSQVEVIEQYYPFAFSSAAFIQCNGESLHVLPCPAESIWSQDLKTCDRIDAPTPVSDVKTGSFQITSAIQQPVTIGRPTTSFLDSKSSSYGYASALPFKETITAPVGTSITVSQTVPKPLREPTIADSYGSMEQIRDDLITVRPVISSNSDAYATQTTIQTPLITPRPMIFSQPTSYGSYGSVAVPHTPIITRPVLAPQSASYGSYGSVTIPQTPIITRPVVPSQPTSYGSYSSIAVPQTPMISRPVIAAQPVSYSSFSVPTSFPSNPQTQGYSQSYGSQTPAVVIPQAPRRILSRVFQPEFVRSFTPKSISSGY